MEKERKKKGKNKEKNKPTMKKKKKKEEEDLLMKATWCPNKLYNRFNSLFPKILKN